MGSFYLGLLCKIKKLSNCWHQTGGSPVMRQICLGPSSSWKEPQWVLRGFPWSRQEGCRPVDRFSCISPAPLPLRQLHHAARRYLPLNITGLALHIFNKLSGTDTGSPEATTGKVTEAGPAKPTWGIQDRPALSGNTPRVLGRHSLTLPHPPPSLGITNF